MDFKNNKAAIFRALLLIVAVSAAAVALFMQHTSKKEQADAAAAYAMKLPTYRLLFIVANSVDDGGPGRTTQMVAIDGKLNAQTSEDSSGSVGEYVFIDYDAKSQHMQEYRYTHPRDHGAPSIGTHQIAPLQHLTITLSPTSPDGLHTYKLCNVNIYPNPCITDTHGETVHLIDFHSQKKFTPQLRFIGWITTEE